MVYQATGHTARQTRRQRPQALGRVPDSAYLSVVSTNNRPNSDRRPGSWVRPEAEACSAIPAGASGPREPAGQWSGARCRREETRPSLRGPCLIVGVSRADRRCLWERRCWREAGRAPSPTALLRIPPPAAVTRLAPGTRLAALTKLRRECRLGGGPHSPPPSRGGDQR